MLHNCSIPVLFFNTGEYRVHFHQGCSHTQPQKHLSGVRLRSYGDHRDFGVGQDIPDIRHAISRGAPAFPGYLFSWFNHCQTGARRCRIDHWPGTRSSCWTKPVKPKSKLDPGNSFRIAPLSAPAFRQLRRKNLPCLRNQIICLFGRQYGPTPCATQFHGPGANQGAIIEPCRGQPPDPSQLGYSHHGTC